MKRWLPGRRREGGLWRKPDDTPVTALQRDMNRLFDSFFEDFSLAPMGDFEDSFASFVPRVNVSEGEKDISVTAELPGMDEKDVDVSLSKGVLTIKGEKKDEITKEDRHHHYTERTSGSFYREIGLPDNVDYDKAEATFKKGVLRVSVPKLAGEDSKRKKIAIKSE